MPGKCPNCEKQVDHVTVEPVASTITGPNAARTTDLVSFSCGACGSVLNIGPDPFWLMRKIAARTMDAMKPKETKAKP